MAKKQQKNPNEEIFEALRLFEQERGIPVDYMISKIEGAIRSSVKKSHDNNDDIIINIDPETNTFDVFLRKVVVEEVTVPGKEILPQEAVKYDSRATLGETVSIRLDTKEFGRIAAQSAKQVIRQGISEMEKGQTIKEVKSKAQEVVTATVERIDERNGAALLKFGKTEAFLQKSEQVGNEVLNVGDQIKICIVGIKDTDRGPKVVISRTHPMLVKRLFELEVPEIFDGTVEIKAVSREAGSRTKIAVLSNDPEVDPVGSCIGARGTRVGKIVEELGGEKIDIIPYSEDPAEFVAGALSPAKVLKVEIDDPEVKSCRVTVPDSQLSLAIGNKGQNARLAAKLTGWKIDIRPESGFFGEEE